jgi:segregation and condensation protein A
MTYDIRLPAFEGPFDLLLHLIRQNQVDIYDIPISLITDQYLAYLDQMKEMDLEVASSFLVIAATLLAIKAKMLLPTPPADEEEEPEDARAELVHDLLEYMVYKDAARNMEEMVVTQRRYFARPNEDALYLNMFSEENPLTGKTLDDLQAAFAVVMKKAEARGMVMHIGREQITLHDRLGQLYRLIKQNPKGITFFAAFEDCQSKMGLIVTFLALLELMRQSVVKIMQNNTYGEIYLYPGDLDKYERE